MDKRFRLIELFYDLRLLGKYDLSLGKFDKSLKFYILSYLFLFAVCIFVSKMCYIYLKIDNEDKIAILLIGDIFFNFNSIAKFWVTIAAIIANFWYLSIHQTYLYLHNKKENLLIYFLKLIYEIKPEKENEFDKEFFEKSSKLNYKLDLFLKWMVRIASMMISILLNLLFFKVNITILYPLILFHYLILSVFFWNLIKIVANLNIIIVTLFLYFIQKFAIISKKLNHTKDNNYKLLKLINNFNQLNYKIIISNLYLNYLFGYNLVFLTAMAIILSFLMFSVDPYFRTAISFVLFAVLVVDIYIPYQLSTNVQKQIQISKNQFRKFLFNPKIKLKLKIAIKSLIEDNEATFKSFNFYELNSYNAFQITFYIITTILLLLKIYYINSN